MTCESATPSEAKHTTPAAANSASSGQSRGQGIPNNSLPARVMIVICSAVFVTALAASPPRYTPAGSGVPRIRLSTPCPRRNVRLKASAVNVVDRTDSPAIPGTITFRSCWLPENTAPNSPSRISGNRKLKKAALGLRQNSRRSSRYWRQVRATTSVMRRPGRRRGRHVGGQLQVHVLQRRPRDRELVQPLAPGQGGGR